MALPARLERAPARSFPTPPPMNVRELAWAKAGTGFQMGDEMVKRGEDVSFHIEGVLFIHQNLPARRAERHDHAEHHLFIPLQGSVELNTDDATWEVPPGQMVYIPSGLPHSFRGLDKSHGERLICMFTPKAWTRHQGIESPALRLPVNHLAKELIFYLVFHPKTKTASALVSALVGSLCEQLAEGSLDALPDTGKAFSKQARDARVRKTVAILEESYFEELPISELAAKVEVPARTLSRLFDEELGLSPKQVLTRIRVREAEALLTGTKLSVTDVAYEVGFGSLSRFISTFRACTGRLPSDMRGKGSAV